MKHAALRESAAALPDPRKYGKCMYKGMYVAPRVGCADCARGSARPYREIHAELRFITILVASGHGAERVPA
jgi:hypothetical protein